MMSDGQYEVKACADGTYRYVPVHTPIKIRPKSTAIGRAEDYSLLCAVEGAVRDKRDEDIIYLRNCIKELRDRVKELNDIVEYKGIIFESCEEIYAEEWRET